MNNDWREYQDELFHHGIKGQKWGVRRFETEGGHLTAAGKARYDGDKVSSASYKKAFSGRAAAYRALGALHTANTKAPFNSKAGRRLSSAAAKQANKAADEAQKEADAKRDAKETARLGKMSPNMTNGKFNSYKDYKNANKMAEESYKKRLAEIKDEKRNSDKGFIAKNVTAYVKNKDAHKQWAYDVNKNTSKMDAKVLAQATAHSAAKEAAKSAAIAGAVIVGGMLAANYKNNQHKRETAGALPMKGMENYWEFKVGKEEVAKYIAKNAAVAAVSTAALGTMAKARASQTVRAVDKTNSKYKNRYNEDSKKWQEGKV